MRACTTILAAFIAAGTFVRADEPATALSGVDSAQLVSVAASGESQELLKQLVIRSLPELYEDTKQWGQTKRVWNGVDVSIYRFRLDTKRRWRDVNHGTWKRYQAWLIDPQESFQIRVENIRPTEDERVAFDVEVQAHLGLFARLSEWQRGLQLISVGVDAEAVVRLKLACEARMRLDFAQVIPDVVIEPKVTDADLHLVHFELQRISDLHGPVVEELGDSLHKVLQRELDERRAKLVANANRELSKNKDTLRLSVSGLAKDGWRKAGKLLGES